MKAVELYIQSGCREGTIIRILGYPSHTALRNWYKDYLTAGHLRAGSVPKPCYTQADSCGSGILRSPFYNTDPRRPGAATDSRKLLSLLPRCKRGLLRGFLGKKGDADRFQIRNLSASFYMGLFPILGRRGILQRHA